MFNDCSKVVESYLLYQNPFYAFSLPISLIVAIIVYGICVSMKCTSNSYMLQIIIPLLTIIIVNVIIEFVVRSMLNKKQINELTETCIKYLEKKEDFENKPQKEEKEVKKVETEIILQKEELHFPLKNVDNLYNSTYEVINKDTTPYTLPYNGLNGLNSASNCPIA